MSAEGARLTRADGQIELAEDANELMTRALGWRLPVTQMERWLDGEFALVTERAADGTPRSAIDSEWRIRIDPPRRWALEWPADLNSSPALMPERRIRVRLLLDP
jgi:outer membrane biogenesis lipoprotein LolB